MCWPPDKAAVGRISCEELWRSPIVPCPHSRLPAPLLSGLGNLNIITADMLYDEEAKPHPEPPHMHTRQLSLDPHKIKLILALLVEMHKLNCIY